jgi:hypothetical protein
MSVAIAAVGSLAGTATLLWGKTIVELKRPPLL